MKFEPGLAIGQVISNSELTRIFQCGNMGGMRRSKAINSLVLIADHTKDFYEDRWVNGMLLYTGMGLIGNQSLDYKQNKTLANHMNTGIQVFLFEVSLKGKYTYKGEVFLCDIPFQMPQEAFNGSVRKVWMFPLQLKK
jgi:5-methylcytosine-specific restriction protein A